MDKLETFSELVKRWNPRINLVSTRDLERLWERHIADSAQIYPHLAGHDAVWVDIGSGGGFPGVVTAIIATEKDLNADMHLIESDQRKCAFLRQVAREIGLPLTVHAGRVEAAEIENVSIITARAFASVTKILALTSRLRSEVTKYLLLKGRTYESELTEAEQFWKLKVDRIPSRTDPEGSILALTEVYPRHDI
ncbi:MAG: 16S rRNA (guanine(527)-N(7))-methyltransferase RsmG [Pseudomonadota bacterium]